MIELEGKLKAEPELLAEVAYQRAVACESRSLLDFVDPKETPRAMSRVDPDGKSGAFLVTAKKLFGRVATDLQGHRPWRLASKHLKARYENKADFENLATTYQKMAIQTGLQGQLFILEAQMRALRDVR